MKKFLSLVLALVMTMSLVTVAGAADFTDDASVNYDEAVDVVAALDIVGGYPDGSFNPKGTLTRQAAAKIICNINVGPDAAADLAAAAAPFADVAADNQFAGYIAYCVNEGIVAGYTPTTFAPANTLTGYAFLKMLLVTLGYDATIEGYVGTNAQVNILLDAKAAGLLKGYEGTFVPSKAITREEAALFAFNALNAQMVGYSDKGSNITIGEIQIATGASSAEVKWDDTAKTNPTLLREVKFEDLESIAPYTDVLGRPATTWNIKGEDEAIGTYALTADKVLVAEEAYADLAAMYKDLVDDKSTLVDNDFAGQMINGRAWNPATDKDADNNWIAVGDVVELFENEDGDITNAIVSRYDLKKITEVSTSLTKAQKEKDATAKIKLDGAYILDVDFEGFDAKTYTKDTYVLVIEKAGKVIASEVAETIEGKVSTIKGDKATIGGTAYVKVDSDVRVGSEGTFYLGMADEIVEFVGTTKKSENYAFIYNLVYDDSGKDADGQITDTWTAYYVTVDGTKGSAAVKTEKATGTTNYYFDDGKSGVTDAWALSKATSALNALVAYSINADGEFVREVAQDTIGDESSAVISKTDAEIETNVNANGKTVFVFVKDADGKYKPSVVTGYKNVNIDADVQYVVNEDKEATYVFVNEANGSITSDTLLAVVLDTVAVEGEDADGESTYTYAVAIDGDEAELTFAAPQSFSAKGVIFAYEVEDGIATVKSATIKEGTVSVVGGDYIKVAGTYAGQYAIGEETVYTITKEYKVDGVTLDTVTVSEGGAYVNTTDNNTIFFTTNTDGDLDKVFVVDIVK